MNLEQFHMPALSTLALGVEAFVMAVLCLVFFAGAYLFEGAALCLVCLAVAHGEGASFVAGQEIKRDMNGLADRAGERVIRLADRVSRRSAAGLGLARIKWNYFAEKVLRQINMLEKINPIISDGFYLK